MTIKVPSPETITSRMSISPVQNGLNIRKSKYPNLLKKFLDFGGFEGNLKTEYHIKKDRFNTNSNNSWISEPNAIL